jgi:hypothetical protein
VNSKEFRDRGRAGCLEEDGGFIQPAQGPQKRDRKLMATWLQRMIGAEIV